MLIYIILILIIIVGIYLYNVSKPCGCEEFKSDYSDYNSIDRIQVGNDFAYCIGATPTCETGVPIKAGLYSNGNTYRSICDDGSNMVCNNFFSTNFDISKNSQESETRTDTGTEHETEPETETGTDTGAIEENYTWNTQNGTPILFSKIYKGFTKPTSYVPAVINSKLINFYDSTNSIVDTMNKCSLLGIDENKCKKALDIPFTYADTENNDLNVFNNATGYNADPDVIGSFFPSYTEKVPQSKGISGMYPGLPCIADYGASEGDNICNGEVGLLQDQSLVCPYYKPICNYRCGTTLGKCSYSK